ncbi:membrane protein insertase, YidC/Oxa1 family, C-terminal domain-containing protein [[Clostridium] aminophilum]|uniref:Membrane protein insertase, YidC/Oxa1 family, C-terminal domain-containing protein n=1 Tax=[Clostridium] aminophilum TaxID=1526 RepID=A0A1I0H5J9_9FIRM|nr:YidC/Oxa1 family membrane protein insertase [[Clostridium] aminophilum]SET78120.1 membrane protein insertase, YidC/Oxa1 family, C-terminal domain-containing protein [[Clostridium] aminophilum]
MNMIDILYTILIEPLRLLFEVIFVTANRFTHHPGLSIIALSLAINILVLPLYDRADAVQAQARDMEKKLKRGVDHIKKVFDGDERMMMLNAYYRQNNYRPTDAIKGSVSLFLEIPFFISAYRFLSNLVTIQGVSFGPIADLGSPDALLHAFGMQINVLPFLMTGVNLISCAIFTKGYPLKTKIQLNVMALFFLFFLYTSPAGLVFYWTLNNLFSLVKTIVYKIIARKREQRRAAKRALSDQGEADSAADGTAFGLMPADAEQAVMDREPAAGEMPPEDRLQAYRPNRKLFRTCGFFLAMLIGGAIPAAVIQASPQEFIDIHAFHNPLWYVGYSFCIAVGFFCVWMRVFYWLANDHGKVIFERLMVTACLTALVNYMFFGRGLGNLSTALQYDDGMSFSLAEKILNTVLILMIAAGIVMVFQDHFAPRFSGLTRMCSTRKPVMAIRTHIRGAVLTASLAISTMTVFQLVTARGSVEEAREQAESLLAQGEEQKATIPLSKTGKNVIVLMLDRGMGPFVPYIFNEKPELKKQFDGFTYYPNTISFGGSTIFGTPGLFGGYEYTPAEMNRRKTELLADKQNEALKVMPVLFDRNGYDVTVCDPTYASYAWVPDLTIYDDYPDIRTFNTKGSFNDPEEKAAEVRDLNRNFFCFGLTKAMPVILQPYFYQNGRYNQSEQKVAAYGAQVQDGISRSQGLKAAFMNTFNVLKNLPDITEIVGESDSEADAPAADSAAQAGQNENVGAAGNKGTFLMMTNDSTHEPMLLQEPAYEPADNVDNTEYDETHRDRFDLKNGSIEHKKLPKDRDMIIHTEGRLAHYEVNMASMIQLGRWFDYMRENGVYDNTKIILVADHGRNLWQFDALTLDDGSSNIYDAESYAPLLMVKDFGATGFKTDDTFMTNADTPTLALKDVIENPVNPFTGKVIDNSEKTAHPQYVIGSDDWDASTNNGTQFTPSTWFAVHDDMWNRKNWTVMAENSTDPLDAAKKPKKSKIIYNVGKDKTGKADITDKADKN